MIGHDDKFDSPIGAVFQSEEGKKTTGHIKLKRSGLLDSVVVSFVDDDLFHVSNGTSMHGISEAGKVSLLECVSGGHPKMTAWEDFSIHLGEVSFRYALFGKEHVSVDQSCIRGIQFNLEGLERNVFMDSHSEVFGLIDDPADEIVDIIAKRRPEYLPGDLVKGRAMVSYFTGNYELLPRTETVLGTVSISRIVDPTSFETSDDLTYVTIDFSDSPTSVDGAWDKMRELRQFFGWMMGYAPAWKDVKLFTSRLNQQGRRISEEGRTDVGILAFGPNEWEETSGSYQYYATLIDAAAHQEHFTNIMCRWLDRNQNEERRSANTRYFGSLRGTNGGSAVEDMIVSAANTFDLLPHCDKPNKTTLNPDLSKILQDARIKVKRMCRATRQKDVVLDGLGRIAAGVTLRSIVQHRAKFIEERFGANQLPDLNEVIRLAVLCRNHYTHGSSGNTRRTVDFKNAEVVVTLALTLQYIYATSELILCGWDETSALCYDRHPLGSFLSRYDYYRSVLKLN